MIRGQRIIKRNTIKKNLISIHLGLSRFVETNLNSVNSYLVTIGTIRGSCSARLKSWRISGDGFQGASTSRSILIDRSRRDVNRGNRGFDIDCTLFLFTCWSRLSFVHFTHVDGGIGHIIGVGIYLPCYPHGEYAQRHGHRKIQTLFDHHDILLAIVSISVAVGQGL